MLWCRMSARKRRAVGVDSRSQSAEAVPAEVAQRTWSIHPHGSGMLATMLTESLTMLAVVNSHLGTLIWLQLCSPQGVALFSFHLLSPRVYRPFTVVPVYGMSLTHAKRLRAMGCGFKGRLIRLFSLDSVNYLGIGGEIPDSLLNHGRGFFRRSPFLEIPFRRGL
jgi:hypothetical protein